MTYQGLFNGYFRTDGNFINLTSLNTVCSSSEVQ